MRVPDPPRRDSLRATVMLVLTTFLWGLSFPLMKSWQDAAVGCPGGKVVASATVILVRMVLGLALLAVVRFDLFRRPTRQAHLRGTVVGIAFFVGFELQVLGLAWTSPAMSGFITSLGSAWVPLLVWLLWRTKVPPLALLGIGLGLLGTALLPEKDSETGWTLNVGDLLTLLASMLFAVEILLLDRLGQNVPAGHLTVSFFAVTAFLSLLLALGGSAFDGGVSSWLRWLIDLLSRPGTALDVGIMTVFCTVLAFHWMNVYQPQVSASRAALIYLLEPVFATIFSIAWGKDQLTTRLLLGGGIILGGNLLVDLPRVRNEWVQYRLRRSQLDLNLEQKSAEL